MKLSRTVSYAVQAALQLAQSGTRVPVPCSQLAAEGKMPERFLLQILRSLVAHGILVSTRGVDGGYMLERSAEEVSLLEVIEAIEGPVVAALPAQDGLPRESRAKLQRALDEITMLMRRQIAEITLADLCPEPVGAAIPSKHTVEPAGDTGRRVRSSARKVLVRDRAATKM